MAGNTGNKAGNRQGAGQGAGRAWRWGLATLVAAVGITLAACGGGQDERSSAQAEASPASTQAAGSRAKAMAATDTSPTTRQDAFRLLTQASFGPTTASLDEVQRLGAAGWLQAQAALPARAVHLARWQAANKAYKASNPAAVADTADIQASFYQEAISAEDQLRQRVAFALSEIIVVSTDELHQEWSESVADWYDMLTRNALGNYRTLLGEVVRHPAMGLYLSHLNNRGESATTGRTPDQNLARELMQLFTIGLVELNVDGTPRLGADGLAQETYGADDIVGLSRVLTGYGFAGSLADARAPYSPGNTLVPERMSTPLQAYPGLHSIMEKRVLGQLIAPAGKRNMPVELERVLDKLFNHPNAGPFIGRQLIQRLVSSHPSPAYVARVAAVFNNNGQGQRGDLGAVVQAILLDDEARSAILASDPQYGKLREPVLRLTALLRAYGATPATGRWSLGRTDRPDTGLAQAPLASPTVFNFFRPGFVPPGGEAARLGLTLPEMQISDETSVAGYVNYMINLVSPWGAPGSTLSTSAKATGVQVDLAPELGLANDPAALVDLVCTKLIGDGASPALKAAMVAGIKNVKLPALAANGNNAAAVDDARRRRVQIALVLAVASPEFIVQK